MNQLIINAVGKPKKIQVVKVESVDSHDSLHTVILDQDTVGIQVFNKPQQTWITVNRGDYLRVDNPEDIYPIAPDYFAKNYDLVE